MKKIIFVSVFLLIFLPFLSYAHNDSGDTSAGRGFMMMERIEDSILGDGLHEEMEGLMKKMIDGNLNNTEISRMSEIMKEYPAINGMMMNRMMYSNNPNYQDHMYQNWGNNLSGIMWFTHILIWIFLIMGIASLWKWLQEK